MWTKRSRSAPASPASLRTIASRAQSTRSTAATVGELEHPLGLVPARQRRGLVAAQDQRELVVRAALAQRRERVRRCTTGPGRSSSMRDTSSRCRPPRPARQLEPHLRPRVAPRAPMRRLARPARAPPCRAPSCTRASCAQTRCPRCGGLKAPPRMPDPRHLLPDLPRALDHELVGGELARADRAAGMELLGRVADLGAHAEHAAVGEARGGVHVHAGGVDARR